MSGKKIITVDEIPPSNNRYLGKGGQGRAFAYQAEKKRWAWMIRAAAGRVDRPFQRARVVIKYYFPDRRRRDPDNYSGKMILDGLVLAGVIEDDSFNHIVLMLEADVDRKRPRTEIRVEEMEYGRNTNPRGA